MVKEDRWGNQLVRGVAAKGCPACVGTTIFAFIPPDGIVCNDDGGLTITPSYCIWQPCGFLILPAVNLACCFDIVGTGSDTMSVPIDLPPQVQLAVNTDGCSCDDSVNDNCFLVNAGGAGYVGTITVCGCPLEVELFSSDAMTFNWSLSGDCGEVSGEITSMGTGTSGPGEFDCSDDGRLRPRRSSWAWAI